MMIIVLIAVTCSFLCAVTLIGACVVSGYSKDGSCDDIQHEDDARQPATSMAAFQGAA